ncbi:MAG: hypothetical protein ACYDEE_15455, partial [Ignavibacteriaceae bacterium]
MLNFKKQFGSLRLGGLSLLMGFLLMGILGVSTTYAAVGPTIDTVGAQAKLAVKLENKSVQDSVVMPTFNIAVNDTLALGQSDSVAIGFKNKYFQFANSGPYKVVVNGVIVADSARVNAAGDSLFIKITGPVGFSNADTLTIAGVYIKAIHTNPVMSDSSTTDNLFFAVGHGAVRTPGAHLGTLFVLLPGSIFTATITTPPASSVAAGSAITTTLSFTDKFLNVPSDSTTTIGVAAVLNGTTTPGNGTLSGQATITITHNTGAPGTDTYQWTALKYTKAENIQLVFTAPGGTVTSSKDSIYAGSPANISVALNSGSSDAITVDQTTSYTLTVTDQYFNPINGQAVTAAENTSHGGTFTGTGNTNSSGQLTAVVFSPSKFFVGADTLKFTASPAIQTHAITINPGAVGGLIVDYAGTANGSAVTEPIAAGVTVYARG